MRLLVTLFLMFYSNTTMQEVVTEFHALETQASEEAFYKKYKKSKDPSVLAYVLAIEMKQAEYTYNPFTMLSLFNQGKKRINALIRLYPDNVHLRYTRLVLQEETPWFLGFDDFLEVDKAFLKKKLAQKDESDFLDMYIYKNTSL